MALQHRNSAFLIFVLEVLNVLVIKTNARYLILAAYMQQTGCYISLIIYARCTGCTYIYMSSSCSVPLLERCRFNDFSPEAAIISSMVGEPPPQIQLSIVLSSTQPRAECCSTPHHQSQTSWPHYAGAMSTTLASCSAASGVQALLFGAPGIVRSNAYLPGWWHPSHLRRQSTIPSVFLW